MVSQPRWLALKAWAAGWSTAEGGLCQPRFQAVFPQLERPPVPECKEVSRVSTPQWGAAPTGALGWKWG